MNKIEQLEAHIRELYNVEGISDGARVLLHETMDTALEIAREDAAHEGYVYDGIITRISMNMLEDKVTFTKQRKHNG